MEVGYIVTIVFAAIWIGFIVFDNVKKRIDKRKAEEKKLAAEKNDDYKSLIL